ncbi:hypothetical protein J2Z33_003446, partial [Rubellimicrobium aerolatum]|nr:hypothetical protein [Rubellimicrobium aerolatum]
EQSSGLAQVNVAVAQMDQITQQNAAMVEETTAAVRAMATQTQVVAHEIDRFRTGAGGSAAEWRQDAERDAAAAPAVTRAAPQPARTSPPRKALRLAAGSARTEQNEGWEEF